MLLALTTGAFAQFPAPYCDVAFQYSPDGNMITRVQFAGIDQTSPFTSGTTPYKENFLAVTGTVTQGHSYPISVKAPSSTFPSDITVYIDWNQNRLFGDPGETYYIGRVAPANPANALTVTADIAVPAGALTGTTRMRVLKNTNVAALGDPAAPNSIPDACAQGLRSGQYEDYAILVEQDIPPVPPCTPSTPGPLPGDAGCVTFQYRGRTVYYATVRAADGLVWLQQNLGSSQVAVSKTDTAAYGHLFQWGRWDDGHQLRNSATGAVPAANNPSGTGNGSTTFYTGTSTAAWWTPQALTDTWDGTSATDASSVRGVDPCKAVGAGWRMPTEAEWVAVIADEAISGPDPAFDSHLKLTIGGSRSSSEGAYNFVGTRGYYWSGTTSSTGAKYLYYSSAITNPSAGSTRGSGASVRCLQIPPVTVDSIDVTIQGNAAPTIIGLGNTLQAQAVIYPANADQNVTWSIVPVTGTATVGTTGTVTAQTAGTLWAKAVSVADVSKKDSVLITVYAACTPTITIATQNGTSVCAASTVTFTSTVTDGGTAPAYQWKKNGIAVGGGPVYTDALLAHGDVISCELTSNAACALTQTVQSAGLSMQVGAVYQTPVSAEICAGESYLFFGTPLTATGTYTHTAAAVSGCDSTVTLTFTVKSAPVPQIGANGNELSTGTFAGYQWLLNGQPAPGISNGQSYQATQSGQYSVAVTSANGCQAVSAVYTHATAGIDESEWSGFNVFPNPARDVLQVQLPASASVWHVSILAPDGRTIRRETCSDASQQIQIDTLPAGVYLLQVRDPKGAQKTVRFIKQ